MLNRFELQKLRRPRAADAKKFMEFNFTDFRAHNTRELQPLWKKCQLEPPPSNHTAIIQVVVGHNGDQAQSTDSKEPYVSKYQPAIDIPLLERR